MNAVPNTGKSQSPSRSSRVETSGELLEVIHAIRLLLHGGAAIPLIRTITGARSDVIRQQAEYEGVCGTDKGGRRYRGIGTITSTVESHIVGSYFLAQYIAYCEVYRSGMDWSAETVHIDDADGQGSLVRGAFVRALYTTRQVMGNARMTALQARMLALNWQAGEITLAACSVCPTRFVQMTDPQVAAVAAPGTHGSCPVCRAKSAIDRGVQPARVVGPAQAKQAWSNVKRFTL